MLQSTHLSFWEGGSLLQASGHHVSLGRASRQWQGRHEPRQLEQLEHDVVVFVLPVAGTCSDERLAASLGHNRIHHIHCLLLWDACIHQSWDLQSSQRSLGKHTHITMHLLLVSPDVAHLPKECTTLSIWMNDAVRGSSVATISSSPISSMYGDLEPEKYCPL